MAARGDENIRGLDVAVNDARAVRGIQRVGDFDAEREQRLQLQAAMPGESLLQRGAFQILHRDEGAAVLLADVMNGADVGMIQRGGGSSLAAEPAQRLPVPSEFVGQELERDEAAEPGVLRFVNDTHSAAAKLLDDAVVGEGLANQGIGAIARGVVLIVGERQRGDFDSRAFQKALRVRLRVQKRADPAFQRLVTRAGLPEKRVALLGRTLQHGLEQVIELFPLIQVHLRFRRRARDTARFLRCSSRASR